MSKEPVINQTVVLTVASLLTLVLANIHLADDVILKLSPAGFTNLAVVAFSLVWLYGTLVLAEQRVGYIITLAGSLLAFGVCLIHMRGAGLVGPRVAASGNAFRFVLTVLAMATSAAFSAVLSARALWRR